MSYLLLFLIIAVILSTIGLVAINYGENNSA